MGNREKILVILMVLALCYGVFELFSSSGEVTGRENVRPNAHAAREIAQKVAGELEDIDLTSSQKHILKLSAEHWQKDPFYALAEHTDMPPEDLSGEREDGIEYTGYLEVGGVRMAIINGVEYCEGQELDDNSGTVKRIYPGKVVIRKNNGEEISVFYKE